MKYTTLNNGIKMPMEGIGTFLLSPDEAENSVLSALKEGYRLIDTANAYMNEKAVGRAIKKSGVPREDIFLETKLWPSFYENEDAVEKTLERLDTDYIDLLLIHQPAGNYIAGYRLMEKAYKEEKVKAIGLSNFTKEGVQEILDICKVKPTVLQTEVHPYDQKKELKEFLAKENIKIQAWYPLGHGDAELMKESAFVIAGTKYKKSTAQVILRWHIQDGNIVIPGSKNADHIKANLDLFDFQLTEEERKENGMRDELFSPEMLSQLKTVFSGMEKKLILRIYSDGSLLSEELIRYARELSALTEKLSAEVITETDAGTETDGGDTARRPCVQIRREDGTWSGLAFHGVPGGHEFTSFILGLYNAAGPGQATEPGLLAEIRARDRPLHMKILVSLSCTMCPELVTAAQRIAVENDRITAEVYDLNHFPDLKERYEVMSVPCLILNDRDVTFGKKNVRQLLERIREMENIPG